MQTYSYTYRVRLQPEPEGGFTVTVPALPGCVTWGETYEHALAMARECIQGFLEALLRNHRSIPVERAVPPAETLIQVQAPAGV